MFSTTPILHAALLLVETAFHFVTTLKQFDIVTPGQLSRQCLDFWISQIELPERKDIGAAKSPTILQSEVAREFIHDLLSVFGAQIFSINWRFATHRSRIRIKVNKKVTMLREKYKGIGYLS